MVVCLQQSVKNGSNGFAKNFNHQSLGQKYDSNKFNPPKTCLPLLNIILLLSQCFGISVTNWFICLCLIKFCFEVLS